MSTYEPERTKNYYLLGDTPPGMVHLIEADCCFNWSMGGLLPEQPEEVLLQMQDVLDIGCGPGGWVLALAKEFPDVQVTGLDVSEGMITYASTLARASQLDNAHFIVGNAIEGLSFPEQSFDLVNIRHLEGVIPAAHWPVLLNEMMRVTRPGGTLRITGSDWGVSNSSAYETNLTLAFRGYMAFGLNNGPDARRDGIINMVSRYLRDAGCQNVQERPSFFDFSYGAERYQSMYPLRLMTAELMQPFLLKSGVTTTLEYERLKHQLAIELTEESFRGIIYTMTAWGQKPLERE